MLKTATELLKDLGDAVRARRLGQGWSQEEAATRAGVGVRTWRRLEADGQATVGTLINAALALRCEEGIALLFPAPTARTMDELLQQQAAAAPSPVRKRVRRARGLR
jgi:transcriptional regulator with XRE-family HTH domain